MINTRSVAIANAKRRTTNVPGTCQKVVRGYFNAPSAGDRDGDGDFDARDGWLSEPEWARHRGDRLPPSGVPLYFSKDGGRGFGHRAITIDAQGTVQSTDMQAGRFRQGITSACTIPQIEKAMGVVYVGWSETIDGYPIPTEPAAPSKPQTPKPPVEAKPVTPAPVKEDPPVKTATFNVAENNLMSLPANKNVHGTLTATPGASVILVNEADLDAFKRVIAALPNYEVGGGLRLGNDTFDAFVLFKPAVWTHVSTRFVKTFTGVSRVSKTRHAAVTVLRHKGTGEEFAFVSWHAVTSGNDKARKAMRKRGLAKVRGVIRAQRRAGRPVVVGADLNTADNVHPTAPIHVRHRIDHIHAWPSVKVQLKMVKAHTEKTTSDHDALVVKLQATVR